MTANRPAAQRLRQGTGEAGRRTVGGHGWPPTSVQGYIHSVSVYLARPCRHADARAGRGDNIFLMSPKR